MAQRRLILRIIVVVILLYSLGTFAGGLRRINETKSRIETAEIELKSLREENQQLKDELASSPDGEKIARLAREKLGLIKPGDKIFVFKR